MSKIIEREIMSEEGVEERVKSETTLRITLTGGGKYRLYFVDGDERPITVCVVDSLEAATKERAKMMVFTGSMQLNPQRTLDVFLGRRTE